LSLLRKYGGVLLAFAATVGMVVVLGHAQPQAVGGAALAAPSSPGMNKNVIVVDAAHGGADAGATLGDKVQEKDVTLALAARLRAVLTAAGFTVVATRDADSANPPTSDQRAETANRVHAVACLVIHATGSGTGVHVYTSALQPAEVEDASGDGAAIGDSASGLAPVPWDTAQAGWVERSLRLAGDLYAAMSKAGLPAMVGRAYVKPLDNMTCPAVAVEIAPLLASGESTAVTDADYQQRVAEAAAAVMKAWRAHVDAPAAATSGGAQ
jgi:N-acetylmuramoyl-L-alanine amidase